MQSLDHAAFCVLAHTSLALLPRTCTKRLYATASEFAADNVVTAADVLQHEEKYTEAGTLPLRITSRRPTCTKQNDAATPPACTQVPQNVHLLQ
jgi:hypothetical protein